MTETETKTMMKNNIKKISGTHLKKLAFLLLVLNLFSVNAEAYDENYPPFPSKNNLSPLTAQPIIAGTADDTVQLGKVEIKKGSIKGSARGDISTVPLTFVEIRCQGHLIASLSESPEELFFIGDIFYVDLDKNGLKDILIPINQKGTGLAGLLDEVVIFFQTEEGKFRKLSYETYKFDITDIVDVNGDGQFEFLTTKFAQLESTDGKTHSYWVYNLYKIEGFNFVIANELHPNFPRVIQFTYKPNAEETKKLSSKQKKAFVESLPQQILSKDI